MTDAPTHFCAVPLCGKELRSDNTSGLCAKHAVPWRFQGRPPLDEWIKNGLKTPRQIAGATSARQAIARRRAATPNVATATPNVATATPEVATPGPVRPAPDPAPPIMADLRDNSVRHLAIVDLPRPASRFRIDIIGLYLTLTDPDGLILHQARLKA